MAETLRADVAAYESERPGEQKPDNANSGRSLLTPARRAALDALEREFNALLQLKTR